ncbi:hypothetical protein A2331_00610 [Candidatus Falkowbacteria bacterium RIFOXYB2_FULL_34_18]|uniref:Uncharacterized protein n=1 Tax=Candidatus Falkowbacteria bacterium RIFOXYD2_FULL_34_120 TaxID=1798007 RepID=A0A1F5TM72_9BACT|nr:MAG: hypothetical protein A2331_00610 [Candidatus Falkowbacteria bacterium RIFOXYB2_FULL_34_18]OGF29193.1 MAG: hypothetical protein A2500_05925 [Candidatus Falkowbacteria bacterium RIFOXYC12_FULL_34_55]OGF37731.1 MAG: hypothetical protein A2466_06255 [Candidatus Falkowbacteria bacterium RIFOXYC2_FULL_34_220]OGF38715.1 MAG: hypothetical protein A2515_01590 [Candidatus Falkowbacteria bacterium RIFOXYD12_FULL_34_57]OGF39949.1 MAG: hypothetical protein A2531_01845 [Candidatus Falkowbacteria bact
MLKYFCTSLYSENLTWEDFFPVNDDNLPRVTVDIEKKGKRVEAIKFSRDKDDGWYDAYIPSFTVDNVKSVLAQINGTTPEEIEIDWQGTIQAC